MTIDRGDVERVARLARLHLEPDELHDMQAAMDVCLEIIEENAARVDGIKISVLDAQKEIAMRRRLPDGVRMYSGDESSRRVSGSPPGVSKAALTMMIATA